jgi:hypothetical protein
VEENKTALTIARENIGTEGKNFFALRDDQWVRQMGGGKRRLWQTGRRWASGSERVRSASPLPTAPWRTP